MIQFSYDITKTHGGELKMESQIAGAAGEVGTTFIIIFQKI